MTAPAIAPQDAFVARQPICERNQKTFAYELLFRHSDQNRAVFDNPDRATAQVIVNSFLEIGLERMVGPSMAFINVTRDFIVSDHCRSLPKDRVVFEILEDTKPDPELMNALSSLRAGGYRFALDDFTFQEDSWPLVPHCSFIKVDVQGTDIQAKTREMARLRESSAMLLAEKVETTAEFERCHDAGFQYFQGYFFCKPKVFSGTKAPLSRLSICRLLAKLQEPDISIKEIEEIVRQDLGVSYQLLRYINSAALCLPKKIESINHAVRLVGMDHIRLMASLMMLAHFDDKPRELLTTSLVRARMCELLAKRLDQKDTDTSFTVGLFSALDAFLDCSMDKALSQLPFSDTVRNALLRQDGPLGHALQCVLAYERADWNALTNLDADPAIGGLYLDALNWSDALIRRVSTSGN